MRGTVEREMPTSNLYSALLNLKKTAITLSGRSGNQLSLRSIIARDFRRDNWVWEWDTKTPVIIREDTFVVITGIWAKEMIEVVLEDCNGNRHTILTTGCQSPYYHVFHNELINVSARYLGSEPGPQKCQFSFVGMAMESEGRNICKSNNLCDKVVQ